MNRNPPIEGSRSVQLRRRIFDSACSLLSERGLRETHVREVSRRAEVNPAVLFYLFDSKERLYAAVVTEAGRQLAAAAEDISKRLSLHALHSER